MSFRPPPFYPITAAGAGFSHEAQVRRLLQAGARVVQIREKRLSGGEFLRQIDAAVQACRREAGMLVVNDRVDLALLAGAGGVHVGEEDLPIREARRILGPGAVIGASSHDGESAARAEAEGADYVAIGPIFVTGTKRDAGDAVGLGAVREVREAVTVPLVAIGGITLERAEEVRAAGADSVAVIADISASPDPTERAAAYARRVGGGPDRGLLFLTGFMGAGKTTVGELLAHRLGRRFVDLDRWIQQEDGRSIPEIFADSGEGAFRRLESRMLERVPPGGDAVIALGGGTLLSGGAFERVRELGTLVWLQCDLPSSLARCGAGGERPLLATGTDPEELLEARLPGYRSAGVAVETRDRAKEEVVEEILARAVGAGHGI